MSTVEQPLPEIIELPAEFEQEKETSGAIVLRESQQITKIEDEQTYIAVCAKVKDAAANIKAIEAYMQPFIDRAHAAHKRLTTVRGRLTGPFEEAKTKLSALVFNFQVEQEQKRAREEESARAAALKQQQEDQAAQAEQLASEGRFEEGVGVLETPVVPYIPATVATSVPKVKGISTAKESYCGEVVDLMALVKGIAAGQAPLSMVVADQKQIDKACALYRESMSFPGVKLRKKIGGSVRG